MHIQYKKGMLIILVMLMVACGFNGPFIGGEKAYATGEAFAGGTGTMDDPYQIATPDQLDEVRYHLEEGLYFKLTADIDLSNYPADDDAGWMPIAHYTGGLYFRGNFDGNGFKIRNLMINRPDGTFYVGLFGMIYLGTITDVTLEDVNVTGDFGTGGLVGMNRGTVRNSTVTGSVYGQKDTGGLVGDNYNKITTSSSAANVYGVQSNTGGLVGSMYVFDTATISNSFATGDVNGEGGYTGGLVGVSKTGSISNSYATGNVSGLLRIGGLVGDNRAPISNSYAIGSVSVTVHEVGGLAGYNTSVINNSFARGSVIGPTIVGGLVGGNSENGTINNSYATGIVSGTTNVGGLVGLNSGVGAISNSFYDWETTDQSNSGMGKSTADMIKPSTYSDPSWNFSDIWGIDSSRNNGYPYLYALPSATIVGVTAPVAGETPVASIAETAEYTSAITWSPVDETFAASTAYTATITLTPKTGYTLTGVIENFFTVAGATATNAANSGMITAVFPTTAATITSSAITGVTAPVRGETPVTAIMDTTEYTAAIAWLPGDIAFAGAETYTATITLTPKTGYTLTGVGANFFTVAGATATNASNSGVITAVFPATEPSSSATLTSTIGTVSMGGTANETITNIPNGTTLAALKAAITPAADATFEIYNADGTTITTTLATGKKVIVTAQDGITKVTYTVTVRSAPSSSGGDSPPPPPTNDAVTFTDGTLTLPAGRTGEVSFLDEVTVSIPADATDKELKLTIEKVLNTQSMLTKQEVLASSIYEILKNFSENFSKPVTLTFTFDPASLKRNQWPVVFYYDEVKKVWVEVGGKVSGNKISVDVSHFTKYAVLAVNQAADIPATEAPTDVSFSDISGHWAEASIQQAASDGIVSGYPDGTFRPNHTVTRTEFAVMLMNAWKPQGEGMELTFTDTQRLERGRRKQSHKPCKRI